MIDEVGTLWIIHSPTRERFLDGTKDGRDYLGGAFAAAKKYVDVLNKERRSIEDIRYCYPENP